MSPPHASSAAAQHFEANERRDRGSSPTGSQPTSGVKTQPAEQLQTALTSELKKQVQRWLDWQCRMIAGVRSGGVFLTCDRGDEELQAAAFWPDDSVRTPILRTVAAEAVLGRSGISQKHKDDAEDKGEGDVYDHVALPVLRGERVVGAVALTLAMRSEPQLHAVLQLMQWGTVWLEEVLSEELRQRRARGPALLDLISRALGEGPLPVAAHELCNAIADRFDCARVALGMVSGLQVRVVALSHQMRFDRRVARIRELEAAMDECLDQDMPLMIPVQAETDIGILRAHSELSGRSGDKAVYTLPLRDAGRIVGTLTLQRNDTTAFDDETLALLTEGAQVLAPLLALKQRDTQSLGRRFVQASRAQTEKLLGPGHLRLKVVAGVSLLSLVLLGVIQTDHRISARSTVEGAVQQAIVAPQMGFLATASARAGDLVQQDDVLATLDQRDLLLEHEKWRSERDKHAKEYQEALALRDRPRASVLAARMEQAAAQLRLVEKQLERTSLRAPFAGVVVSGDLSRSLGTPVERGQLLFEIAPLDGYRVALAVDEHDVAALQPGQSGRLRLTGFPDRPIDLKVVRVMPVAQAGEGGNVFRVEAEALNAPTELRPGMEGVAKVVVGRGSLLWVWTHALVDRLRLWAWSVGF